MSTTTTTALTPPSTAHPSTTGAPVTSGVPTPPASSDLQKLTDKMDVLANGFLALQRHVLTHLPPYAGFSLSAGAGPPAAPLHYGLPSSGFTLSDQGAFAQAGLYGMPGYRAALPNPPPLYGLPGYGGLLTAPSTTSVLVHTTAVTRPVRITQINFPHSPSPLPIFTEPSPSQAGDADDDHAPEPIGVPRYAKLSFSPYDGCEDPLGWLNRCEYFFYMQRTGEADKVGLAVFHMTGAAQQWALALARDVGAVTWPHFKALCQQRFGPAIGINHLADLARLPFHSSVDEYIEAFLARMAHAGYLALNQQVQLFTGGLPESLRIDVELQTPPDLQRAMALARRAGQKTRDSLACSTRLGIGSARLDSLENYNELS